MNRRIAISAAIVAMALAAHSEQAAADDASLRGKQAGDVLVRLRAIGVVPDENDSSVSVIGGSLEASNTAVPELDFSYFFTDRIAAELILATTPHNISANRTALGTLTLQYHPFPLSRFSPYAGVGLNLTLFYAEDEAGGHGVQPGVRRFFNRLRRPDRGGLADRRRMVAQPGHQEGFHRGPCDVECPPSRARSTSTPGFSASASDTNSRASLP